jgi:nuclear transport factor 2 (NTF2) superfamily protein
MSAQPRRSDANRNPRTLEEARALVAHVESLFMPWNIDALVDGFTQDCIVRFGTVPEFRGHDVLRGFFTARSARQRGYKLTKQLRAFTGDSISNSWNGEWQDAESGTARSPCGRPPSTSRRRTRLAASPMH